MWMGRWDNCSPQVGKLGKASPHRDEMGEHLSRSASWSVLRTRASTKFTPDVLILTLLARRRVGFQQRNVTG